MEMIMTLGAKTELLVELDEQGAFVGLAAPWQASEI